MFGLSLTHLLIALVVLLILAPRRLNLLFYAFGKAIRGYKDSRKDTIETEFKKINSENSGGSREQS